MIYIIKVVTVTLPASTEHVPWVGALGCLWGVGVA